VWEVDGVIGMLVAGLLTSELGAYMGMVLSGGRRCD
jgi:hypothetical protein